MMMLFLFGHHFIESRGREEQKQRVLSLCSPNILGLYMYVLYIRVGWSEKVDSEVLAVLRSM